MKNTISARIADFLKRYPPFRFLKPEDLNAIAAGAVVLYKEKDVTIFEEGDDGHELFYIVHKGAVNITKKEDDRQKVLDKCDEGDIFGLRPVFANESYQISAITAEETILYGISVADFKPLVLENKQVGQFLLESFASNTRNPYSHEHKGKLIGDLPKAEDSLAIFELQPVGITKHVISCSPDTQVSKAAGLMTQHHIGSVVVTLEDIPKGILTDKDLRQAIAHDRFSPDQPVSEIMTSPVICYPEGLTIAQAQVTMIKHGISHLCITEDGTPNTRVIGMVTEHDVIVSQGNNPTALIKTIKRAGRTKDLKKIRHRITHLLQGYLDHNIPMTHISKVMFELNDATIKRVIERRLEKTTPPPCDFAWLSLGSQGRKEQILTTDQDNAIIFANQNEKDLPRVRQYFLDLAGKINKDLKKIGFDYCPAEMMAKNERWCLSLDEWKEQFTEWISNPGTDEILLCSIFFDYDITYGDVRLVNELSDHILKLSNESHPFLNTMAMTALQNPPPLGFFRQFLVESNGEHKDFFDLKKRAIMPITDAGRLLLLQHWVKNINNTADRFEKLAELEPQNKELYLSCSYASKALQKFRAKQGLLHNDSGRFIELETLNKEEKIKLKRCFKSLREVQELIKLRFKITNLI
ncbi:DUF294 nucleotidyltransferase-like domain-containing protein [Robertkochia aurantiaca]|uniref:DUF294 nucleotidyltransferase-like domain-containing protein n=1 Tax=Robertkochia aurantiaca TaxID=2873700 RepID=UPI001CCEE495|nr:DUF294 nucleotidyltransferase-like domain-containing protein [Robertkochia sp. 3YJGBD-33]